VRQGEDQRVRVLPVQCVDPDTALVHRDADHLQTGRRRDRAGVVGGGGALDR
jgi:hypothetical protein